MTLVKISPECMLKVWKYAKTNEHSFKVRK